ncbi:MAG TPA: ECF-type sigma factor [Thermoanaerobaculia bacterium]|nr:ECF-type sigma factor [Thermoanaerobaculia bacterium]
MIALAERQSPAGDGRETLQQLVPMVYEELRRLARRQRRRLAAGQTLDTTALVHEAYLKMTGHGDWQGESHVLAAAAIAMRQILVDYARQRSALKRGGGLSAVPLEEHSAAHDQARQVLALDLALRDLAAVEERLVRVVECRVFAGFSEQETARALSTSLRTVQRDWARARTWLQGAFGNGGLS